MKKKLELILSKGFLPPNELPKVFSTDSFAKYYVKNRSSFIQLKKASKCIRLSCPKVGLSRKQMKIPNPIHYGDLATYIIDNWSSIEPIINKSEISNSKPVLTLATISKPLYNFKNFSRNCIRDSYKYMYELNTDISKFYPSIYTHSIAWAVDGKDISKDPQLRKGTIGDNLDIKVRLLQDNQTIGIPIGPYCSQIISELISSRIDVGLQESVEYLIGHRFIDDRKLYFDNYNDAEKCYNSLLSQLSFFELEPNTTKTRITKLPIPLSPEWIIDIQNFNFREPEIEPKASYIRRKRQIQETDLINFFSIVFNYALKLPNEYIFKYSIKVLKNIEIADENIDLFESLIYKTLLTESSTVPEIVDLLIKYKTKISLSKLNILVHQFLELHSDKGHDYEIIWALYIARIFKLKIKLDAIKWLDNYSNSFLKYIAYDLNSNSLIKGNIKDKRLFIKNLFKGISTNDLLGEDWLFAYFAYYINFPDCDFTQINDSQFQFFKNLKANKVEFYNSSLYKNIFTISKRKSTLGKKVSSNARKQIKSNQVQYTIY